jgi:hypothetical protein
MLEYSNLNEKGNAGNHGKKRKTVIRKLGGKAETWQHLERRRQNSFSLHRQDSVNLGGYIMVFVFENLSTIVISAALLGLVGRVVYKLIKDKRSGKSLGCGCGCSDCPSDSACHRH